MKPLQSTVLGAALYQGRLRSLDENALRYWLDPFVTPHPNDREITFRQFAQYQDRWNEPEPPGTFRYNNSGATAAGACIAGLFAPVRGPRPKGIAEAARTQVMQKIRADWDLWYLESAFSPNPTNAGPRMVLESSVYELAKLGYLWLQKGKWKQSRIFSDAYYKEATTGLGRPIRDRRRSDSAGTTAIGGSSTRQKLLPDVPEDAFYHIGNGSPNRATGILIIPSSGIVAVLSMERLSDQKKWDVIQNSRLPGNEGPRLWAREVAKLHSRAE